MSNRKKGKAAKVSAPKTAVAEKSASKQPKAGKTPKKFDSLSSLEELSGVYEFFSATDQAVETVPLEVSESVDAVLGASALTDDAPLNIDDDQVVTSTIPGLDGASIDDSGLEVEHVVDSPEDIEGSDEDFLNGIVVVDDARSQSIQELLSYISVRDPQNGALTVDSDCSAISAEILSALELEEIKALTALYKLTYDGMAKTAADDYADELIKRITNSASHCAVSSMLDQRQHLLIKMCQDVQRVFNTDVVYDKLTADQFTNRAIESIKDNSVLRSSICELGRAMNHPDVPGKADIASLKSLVRIISHAAAHLHSVPGFRASAQAAITRLSSELATKDKTIAKLEAALATKQSEDAIAVEVAVQTARAFPSASDIPRSIMIANGDREFLCYLDHRGVPTRRPIKDPSLAHIGWTTNMARAIGFTTKTEAVSAVERILLLESSGPFWDASSGMKMRGREVRDLRYARIAAVFSERV